MTSNGALLEVEGASKRFGPVQALDRVDFEVHAGEVVGLVGDNGAGKSTLVKAIAGIHSIDSGDMRFDGEADLDPSARRMPRRSASPPSTRTWRSATTSTWSRTSSSAGRSLFRPRPRDARWTRRRWSSAPRELSRALAVTIPSSAARSARSPAGQRQQVAIARSLLGEPKVVLLDEPTAALGVAADRQVLDLIERLRDRGLGVVVISHNLANVFAGRRPDRGPSARQDRGRLRGRADHRGARRRRRSPARGRTARDTPTEAASEEEGRVSAAAGGATDAPRPKSARSNATTQGDAPALHARATSPRCGS